MANPADFVTWERNVVTRLLDAIGESNEVTAHYVRLAYSDIANMSEEEIQSVHPDLTRADVVAGVVSLDAINAFIAAGHGTNLERLRRLLTT